MAKMDISEKRLPQDGRIKIRTSFNSKRKEIDYRVSSLPTLFGETIVMRILDRDTLPLDMSKLGFEDTSLKRVETGILKPYGMALVAGPTGSGKTSTLYSALNRLNTPETNIITAEDPIEYNFEGINQVQIKEQEQRQGVRSPAIRILPPEVIDGLLAIAERDDRVGDERATQVALDQARVARVVFDQ
jgi:type IV pilus assembly protein PilB